MEEFDSALDAWGENEMVCGTAKLRKREHDHKSEGVSKKQEKDEMGGGGKSFQRGSSVRRICWMGLYVSKGSG